MAKKSRKKSRNSSGTPRSKLGKKNAATRRLTATGIKRLPKETWGDRGFTYEFYELPALDPDQINQALDRARLDFFKNEAASLALQLEILETRTNQTFTNQTPFMLYTEDEVAEFLAEMAEEIVDDPSPDFDPGKGKPNFVIVRVVVVVQRGTHL